ncbi:MAG: M42 family metallopeptidase [Methanomassiliicoccales archaeon]|nr:M42 family metallopeptidase [Methanomassiliicoccales archaeon]
MDKESLKFLEDLCNSLGPAGFEREATLTIKNYVQKWSDSVYNDRMGSLVFEKKGTSDSPTVLLPGHVDEIGFMITAINDKGYLNFCQLGGWFDQTLLGQRVIVMSKKGNLRGVIAVKPPHLMDEEERKKVVTKDKMFIAIGCGNKDEAEEMGVRVGDAVVPDSAFSTMKKRSFKDGKFVGNRTLAWGRGFDDRMGAYIAAQVVRTLSEKRIEHPNRVVGAATVQEEVGLRGARTVANLVKPDVAIVLDVDIAGDVPGIEPQDAGAKMGEGVGITAFDASMIPNQALKELTIEICEKQKIPYQLTHIQKGGTDAGAIHIGNVGCPSIVLGPAVRHIHSHVAIADLADLDNCVKLVVELTRVLNKDKVESLVSI